MARRIRVEYEGAFYHVINIPEASLGAFPKTEPCGWGRRPREARSDVHSDLPGLNEPSYIQAEASPGRLQRRHRRVNFGVSDPKRMKEVGWRTARQDALRAAGRTESDLVAAPKMAPWKIALAAQLREQVAARCSWLGHALALGHPTTLRSSVWRLRDSQRATA